MASIDMPYKIDTHSHFLPPAYRQACIEHGHENPDGMPYLPEWSEEGHLEMMHKQNIKRSILSISSPGTHLIAGDHKLASRITRECNAYAADLKKRRPGQFGYFASLPIPFVDICLQEIETASKEGCDGFIMMTNGFGVYPGNAVLDPVFEELNRRMATVFFHPTRPICPCSPEALANGQQPTKATPFAGQYPDPMLEFMFDTARTVANLFLCGTIRRSPKIQFIFPHCVGALPPLLPRFTAYSSLVPGPWTGVSEDEAREAFQKQIWVDLAGVSFPYQVKGLMATIGVPHHRLFYGSDYPFTKPDGVQLLRERMDKGAQGMFSDEEIVDVYHRNAERLLSYPKVR